MIYLKNENEDPQVYFGDVAVGDLFKYRSSFYIKCSNSEIVSDAPGTAYGFSEKSIKNFNNREKVIPYDAELIIKKYST